jgi:glyoxylase-like metal-dependent hydrolase (beta-lactamase superfamily II)
VTLPAPGHTPGHTVFAIHSGDQSLLVLGDTAQHPAVFARHPDWQAAFDIDGDAAVATRFVVSSFGLEASTPATSIAAVARQFLWTPE